MIIAISGWPQSGKDTMANRLVSEHGFVQLGMNTILMEACVALNPIVNPLVGNGVLRYEEVLDQYGYEDSKRLFSEFRAFMQRLGSEFAEAIGHRELWVSLLMERVEPDVDYVMSSCRRVVEADAIRATGGYITRVNRVGATPPNDHPVEREMDDYQFDVVTPNAGTIDDLNDLTDKVVAELRL